MVGGGRASARPPFWLVVTRIVRRVVGEGWVYVLRKAEVGTGVDGWGSPFRSRQMGGDAGEERTEGRAFSIVNRYL